jgi:hypothetical protein
MSDHERMLLTLGSVLERIARPHPPDESLPADVQASLRQLGFPCDELTPREELIPRLWERKRSLLQSFGPEWGDGPGLTPPTAA